MLIRGDSITVAEIQRRHGQRSRLSRWESFACEDQDTLSAMKRLRAARRIGGGACTMLLRHGEYQLLQVDAPTVPKDERRDALRWRIKEMVDFPIERAGVDVLDVPMPQAVGGRSAQVFVVAASHDVLQSSIRLFQDAKLPLRAIDIPELAQRNVAALLEQEGRGLALLAFDDAGGRLTFSRGGELYATRHIDVTRDALVSSRPDAGGVHERVLLDVQRSLDNFDRNFNAISLSGLVVAPLPDEGRFVSYLKTNLYQSVDMMDLSAVLDLEAVPSLADPLAQSDALLAIGAALRDEAMA